MVLAAGLGTRLRPLTWDISKPMVPVANRPIMEHVLQLLARNEVGEVIANLHWYGDSIRNAFGDGSSLGMELSYSEEEELLGTAGGVRKVSDFFGSDPFVVLAADALTDIDIGAVMRTHEENDWIATLTAVKVADTSEYGVIVSGNDGRVQGFQEKPDPAEALSDLANCMIYVFEPEIFDYFPGKEEVDFALDVFPALLSGDVPFGIHPTEEYWNDVGSLREYLQGNLDAITGAVDIEVSGELIESADGIGADIELEGPVLLGEGAEIGDGARLDGPLVIGPGAKVGAGARIKESVLLPGTEVPQGGVLAGAIAGNAEVLAKG
jgi:mannose-1-phosphate guanylyltransferase/mannose-1-phosphate guanylyltransferase/phosphomannomutase